jgi:hypothetical protein
MDRVIGSGQSLSFLIILAIAQLPQYLVLKDGGRSQGRIIFLFEL